ncbi:MAG: Gfo/Idh/MocA family oxidoreductase [Bacteroidaceae bacterium]|jgi:predicted dehydrogenase|nr:Gfo/Idh/MocA family oxidoreductase [Bacteroidaceae bacterium]
MKISIAGTGKIVGEVLQMIHKEFAGKIEVTGIYSREHSVEHAIDLCQAYAPTGFVYTDYERMLQEAEADYVYIANANHVHHEYAMKAMMAGKNVIVEKPIAVDRVQTEELIDTAIQRCVYCLPAFSLLYMPLFRQLQELVPQLGTIRMIHCNFAQRSSRYDRYLRGELTPVFDPTMAGGTLADLNVYNLCFMIALFGPPRTVRYECNRGFNGIDTSGTLLCHYPTSIATLSASKDSNGLSYGCIQGENGYIEVHGSVSILDSFTLHLDGKEPITYKSDSSRHRLSYEFQEFLALIENRQECHIVIPYVTRIMQEIAIAQERMIS